MGCVGVPLGLAYLGAELRQNGIEVRLIDFEAQKLSVETALDEIKSFKPDFIGISATTPIFHIASNLAREIKSILPEIPIAIGGVHLTILKLEAFDQTSCFDFGIIGEGEKSFPRLVQEYEGQRRFETTPGLIFREDENWTLSKPAELIQDLDSIPFPDRSLLDPNNYLHSVKGKGFVPYTDIFTGRGCPFQCNFCSQHTIHGRQVRYRSVQNTVDEIQDIVENHNIKHIIFMDETLTLKKERLKEICKDIIKRNLNLSWEGWTHVATVDKEILEAMREAGMCRISFGIESGNQDILNKIKKGSTLNQITQAYTWAKQLGFETRGSAIIGHPFETKKTAMDTINFCAELKGCDQVFLNIATPYPGTELYDCAISGKGGIELLTHDFSKFKRYGEPVIRVNDLEKNDLIKLQRYGLWKFYLKPHRILYNIFQRGNFLAGIKNAISFLRSNI